MWFEGLLAIGGFNACLLLDFVTVHDRSVIETLARTALVTPISLVVNELVRRNPPRWMREGSVAVGMLLICLINLVAEGHATTATTLFGAICMLITALFVGVVMRLRFPYALPTLLAMLLGGLWSLAQARTLRLSEALLGGSMVVVGMTIILIASLSLESEERKGFLLALQRDMQATDLEWANQALKELSNLDELTRLPNRRALDERVAALWPVCARNGESLSAIMVDIDFFKAVNDHHGHMFGDETLRHMGTLLPRALRTPGDMAARFGGEEFVLLLPNTDASQAVAVAERLRILVETSPTPVSPQHPDEPLRLTVSCGVSTYVPSGSLKWNDLVVAADQALYEAKCNGRNRVEFRGCNEPQRQRRANESRARRISGLVRARISAHTSAARSSYSN